MCLEWINVQVFRVIHRPSFLPRHLVTRSRRTNNDHNMMLSRALSAAQSMPRPSCRSISSARLTIERTTDNQRFEARPPKEELTFGTTFSDHMLMIDWDKDNQWGSPRIVPYQDLHLSPAASALHYGTVCVAPCFVIDFRLSHLPAFTPGLACFEGMKAYKTVTDESLTLFRPELNMGRLSRSMERLHMPGFDFDRTELLECIKELVRLDERWIPSGEGYSLYLRPTVIATHRFLGLSAPENVLLYVITSPVGPYYKSGFAPVRLTADSPYVRAWPGGTGNCKVSIRVSRMYW